MSDIRAELMSVLIAADGSPNYAGMADHILERFVLISRSELPAVNKVESGTFEYIETEGPGGWSYGLHPDEAPSATDPAHLVAIIEWFRAQGLSLHWEEK